MVRRSLRDCYVAGRNSFTRTAGRSLRVGSELSTDRRWGRPSLLLAVGDGALERMGEAIALAQREFARQDAQDARAVRTAGSSYSGLNL